LLVGIYHGSMDTKSLTFFLDTSIYQSNGRCHDQCNPNYAFAIVQGDNCWCSNYIPANQQSTGKCNMACPGYPSDLCGNESQGLFGYIALDSKPSGTAGAASSTAAVSTTNSPTYVSIPPSSSRSMVSQLFRQPSLRWLLYCSISPILWCIS
jgi:cell wall integrity and stress response component